VNASVNFDRAAAYYDATRGVGEHAMARTVELLVPELAHRGRVLEVGVGTGQVALPLRTAGARVTGIDLSSAMLERLVRKSDGRARMPLARADATRMPFRDDAFGGAYLRWVLHLIPAWPRALEEMIRVVRPGGVMIAQLGNGARGHQGEIRRRCCELVGISERPPGLDWDDAASLDDAMAALGCELRLLGPLRDEFSERLSDYLDEVESGKYSWTWRMDEEARREAVAAIRPWARDRWGPLDREISVTYETYWRAYDTPGA
jgi:SAM-dependent methyltransferase